MALLFQCDGGCGMTATDQAQLTPVGFSEPKTYYCAMCLPTIQQFLADRDVLHTRLAKAWQTELAFLMEAWKNGHPGGKLPDD